MSGERVTRAGGAMRALPAAVVLALVVTAAGSRAEAAAEHTHTLAGPGSGGISTVAGGVGGPGKSTAVAVNRPCGVSAGAGHMVVAQTQAVREISQQTGWLTTPAGTGAYGPAGDGGQGASASVLTCGAAIDHVGNLVIAQYASPPSIRVVAAKTGTFYGKAMTAHHIYTVASGQLTSPMDIVVDGAGNLVVADNSAIEVLAARTGTFYGQPMTAGHVYGVAGNGIQGFSGDGGPAASAQLNQPQGVAVDGTGNLVIADTGNNRARVVAESTGEFYGQPMTAGDIYTVAGTGTRGFSGDGGPSTGARLNVPRGVAVDGTGNAVIADTFNNRIRVLAAGPGTFYGRAMTAGHIYTVAGAGGSGFTGDRGPAVKAKLRKPGAVAVDGAGDLVIADTENFRVRVVAAAAGTFYGRAITAGNIYTAGGNGLLGYSGDGAPATRAEAYSPLGVARDQAGNLVVLDSGNNVVRVVAAGTGEFYGRAMTAGDIYTVAGNGTRAFSGDGGPATSAALNDPYGVAVDGAGNLVIADFYNNRIRVVAASTGTFYGQAMTAGDIYTVVGHGVLGFGGDGGPAAAAKVHHPEAVAVDGAGNLVIGDSGNNRVRVVAASTGTFYGQAMTAGDIYTVAGSSGSGYSGDGGPATKAALAGPAGVAVDGAGNLVLSDTGNNVVRVVAARDGTFYGRAMTAGDIYTVAGDGTPGFAGESGAAASAELYQPFGVAVDAAGGLVIADASNARVRVVPASTGEFYGKPMTAGHIYTIAGNGTWGLSGDGGPGTGAELYFPAGVTTDGTGNVMIADADNNRVRMVAR